MKRLITAIAIIPLAVGVVFFGLGLYSTGGKPPGLINGKLSPCPNSPNCVSSEASPADAYAIEAIHLGDAGDAMNRVKEAIAETGGVVVQTTDSYLAATYTSSFFKFVDDVEFRLDQGSNIVHVRSSSRVGYSDFNANRDRVEALRKLITK